ncbi:hypothetical protein Nst1_036 [Candidatus Nanobsidianus stetteri]|uniref:Uncharacterized protein n=1 Tax=Nanobsidianus stetteri TaxID=1294122 RepID=R1E5M4_NANST|nr:hypothetical protein Nst1_036 [Candidatus Nanobsidianus stetteri]
MRGKIFDDFMMFIGYYLPIFIIILAGVIFILTSIFKYYHINNPSQYYISIQNQNNQNNQNSNLNTINSTIMVDIYYQNGYDIYYVPSFIENLSNWNIFYNITNTYSNISNNNILQINPENITNINSTTFNINSLSNVKLNSTISLSNNTFEGNKVTYTYQGNTYECSIKGSNNIQYEAGSFIYFCILCEPLNNQNNQNIQNYYLNEPEYLNITPAIYLLSNSYPNIPNTQYYNYTVNNVEIVNGTYVVITLSNSNGGYSMEDFQNILVTIGPPLSNYINTTPYYGDNVVFLVYYAGKYYALPSWYAGENNGNYYFFINLLNIPSLYNSNSFGCNFLPIFVGFSNENLLPYLNGTIGGDPYALDPSNPSNAIEYDNGLNVFPIYVNFYSYNGNVEDNSYCGNSNGFLNCYQNILYENVLPPYNNVTIYVNATGQISPYVGSYGPFEGLAMDAGQNQGSYALITSNVLQNTFSQLSQSSNGLGLQTFVYFSGIPWEDSPGNGITSSTPEVADAVVLSYVSYNNQFYADTVQDYNADDSISNQECDPTSGECYTIGNQDIGINVGGYTYLPLNFPIFMYEYGWTSTFPPSPGSGDSSGYYVGILEYNSTQGLGYFLTTQYTNNPNSIGYYDYYYSGSGGGISTCSKNISILGRSISIQYPCWGLNYYFVEDTSGSTNGYSGSDYFAFMPQDQQGNSYYSQYGVFWLYNWFQSGSNDMLNIFFLMNGNIFNYSLALEQYEWCGLLRCYRAYAIPPNPPASTINGEPIFAQSYINAYNTAFNQQSNSQRALYNYRAFTYSEVNSNNFVPGTFGYYEYYASSSQSLTISYLQDDANYYNGNPYLFISAGSGGGSGYMYLDWVIVTYGVPYVVSVS